MNGPELTPPLFAILSSLIEERIGLCYTSQDRDLLATKLSTRLAETSFESLLDYYYFLRYDPASAPEFQALANSLVVNETFFFRELAALEVIVSQVVAPLVSTGHRARIWCAACSTGEEPLTFAMLLDRHNLLGRVELIATDVSSSVLARAREGHYGRRSLRQMPAPDLAAKWLEVTDNSVRVTRALTAVVHWQQVNLLDTPAIQALGIFDVILCRNVLIYFRDTLAAKVVDVLGQQLRVGGILLVGASESLLRFGSSLVCEERSGAFMYRKPAE